MLKVPSGVVIRVTVKYGLVIHGSVDVGQYLWLSCGNDAVKFLGPGSIYTSWWETSDIRPATTAAEASGGKHIVVDKACTVIPDLLNIS